MALLEETAMHRMREPAHRVSVLFVFVTAVFITALIAANVMAVKVIAPFGWVVPAAIVVFPVTYIFGDILTEVYGYARARQVIWLGFLCNLLFVLAMVAGERMTAAPFWDGQEAYERILGYTPRLLAASFAGYLIGEFVNAYILARLKVQRRRPDRRLRAHRQRPQGPRDGEDAAPADLRAAGGTSPRSSGRSAGRKPGRADGHDDVSSDVHGGTP